MTFVNFEKPLDAMAARASLNGMYIPAITPLPLVVKYTPAWLLRTEAVAGAASAALTGPSRPLAPPLQRSESGQEAAAVAAAAAASFANSGSGSSMQLPEHSSTAEDNPFTHDDVTAALQAISAMERQGSLGLHQARPTSVGGAAGNRVNAGAAMSAPAPASLPSRMLGLAAPQRQPAARRVPQMPVSAQMGPTGNQLGINRPAMLLPSAPNTTPIFFRPATHANTQQYINMPGYISAAQPAGMQMAPVNHGILLQSAPGNMHILQNPMVAQVAPAGGMAAGGAMALPAGTFPANIAATLPHSMLCPLSRRVMLDPVTAADGVTYERQAIVEWMRLQNVSPTTGRPLAHKALAPNGSLRAAVQSRLAMLFNPQPMGFL